MGKLFIFCSLLSFFLSLFFAALTSRFGLKVGLIDMPNERSSHSAIIPRSGGIGIWVAFLLTGLFFSQFQIFTMLAGIVGLIGLLEDRFSISRGEKYLISRAHISFQSELANRMKCIMLRLLDHVLS